jgi:hypothetical protein
VPTRIYKYVFVLIGTALIAQAVSPAFFGRRPRADIYHEAAFQFIKSAEKPASGMVYKYVFGERLVPKNQRMLSALDKTVDLFVSKTRGVLVSSKRGRFSEESFIGPQGTALAANYTVELEMQYSRAEDFSVDFNIAQQLGVISGERVGQFLSAKVKSDMLTDLKSQVSRQFQEYLDIYKQKFGLREVDAMLCKVGRRTVFIPPGEPSYSGGSAAVKRQPLDDLSKLPSASKFMVQLGRFVLEKREKPDPNVDIKMGSFWPSIKHKYAEKKEVCLTKT